MKSIKEKAEAYDSIIEKANKMHSENCDDCKACIEELIPELAESEDERIRGAIIDHLKDNNLTEWAAWLEKQGDYANFRDKAQVGDRITKNEDGVLVNLSQLKRLAKPADSYCQDCTNRKGCINCEDGELRETEQKASYTTIVKTGDGGINALVTRELPTDGEQNPTDKVEPKFKVGDWLIFNERHNSVYQVERIDNYRYYLRHYLGGTMSVHFDNELIRLWTLQDAKSGDVLSNGKMIVIFKHFEEPSYRQHIVAYIGLDRGRDIQITDDTWRLGIDKAKPATKEQRELLFQKMKEAGYTFDFEKKELKKNEQKTKENNGNIGGISSNSEWGEEDKDLLYDTLSNLTELKDRYGKDYGNVGKCIEWLKSLRPQNTWKPSDNELEVLRLVAEKDGTCLMGLYEQLKKLKEGKV